MPPADLPPVPPAIERVVLHDARAIHDCAVLRYADLAPGPGNHWVIALLEPAPDSGSATIPGASLAGGKISQPPGAKAVVQKKGKWKRQSLQGIDWPAEGTYHWTEPLDKPTRVVGPEDLYSPFASGGAIFFRPVPGDAGLAQFGVVHLVFREWAPFLPQAISYVQKQGGAPGDVPDLEALQRMVASENPILALTGFHEIVLQRDLSPAEIAAHLDRVRGPLRGVFGAVLLGKPRPALEDAALHAAADRATTRDTLLPLASAAFSVGQLQVADAAAVARAKALLRRIRQRATLLGAPLATDESLALMCRFTGVGP